MRVHIVNCGTFRPRSRRLFNGAGGYFEPGRLVCNCLLIEGPAGLILVDTGFGTDDLRHPLRGIGPIWTAANRPVLSPKETMVWHVARLGFRRDDVRDIVLTHLDFDHTGGLPDFPKALVHVHEREHEYAAAPWNYEKMRRYTSRHWAHKPRVRTYGAAGRYNGLTGGGGSSWMGFRGVHAIEGIGLEMLLVPLFGHSAGHCGVAIRLPGGADGGEWLFHCGDAYFHHWEIAAEGARTPAGLAAYENLYQYDHGQRIHSRERIRDLVASRLDEVVVMNTHDPVYTERAADLLRAPVREQPAVLM